MPTYDYQCLDCQEVFEAFQKITDQPLKICPKCKGKVKRLISSGSGLIFKGSGFYATDYKKKTSKPKDNKLPNPSCSGCQQSNSCSQANKEKTE